MKLPAVLERATLRAALAVPPSFYRRTFGEPPRNDRGIALDEHMHVLLSLMEATKHPEIHTLGLEGAREVYDNATKMMDVEAHPTVLRTHTQLNGVNGPVYARRFSPRSASDGRACLVFLHGGGFVVGSVDGYDGVCSQLAALTGADVVSVEYALAPEHAFPGGIDDCVAAYRDVLKRCADWGCDPARVAPIGDSAGANLSINISQQQVLDGEPVPSWQFLFYPLTDHGVEHASRDLFAHGYYLTKNVMNWFARTYLGAVLDQDDQHDPRVVPMYFARMSEMPKTYMVSCGFDPLRDECEQYIQVLSDHDITVIHRDQAHLTHGFLTMGGVIPSARHAITSIAAEIRSLL